MPSFRNEGADAPCTTQPHNLFLASLHPSRYRAVVPHPQEVLQGSSAFHDRLHRVVFEVDFDQRAQLSTDFRVIDIDDMLGGNE